MGDHRGHFVWYDLMTTDPEAAQRFYGEVLGWATQSWGDASPPYTMWTAGEQPIGGVMALPEAAKAMGAPPHWIAYIATPEVDATVEKAQTMGGQVYQPPTDIPEVGRFAVLADPHGATFAVFTSATEEDAPAPDQLGHMSWHELMSSDPDGAWRFYSSLFGWKKTDAMEMGPGNIYQMYGLGEQTFGGFMKKPDAVPMSCWLFYTRVADVEQTVSLIKAHGGQVVSGPMKVPGGDRVAQAIDPQGAAFAIHSGP